MKTKLPPRRKAFGVVETEALEDRQVRVVISTSQIDRSGDVVVQAGINADNFRKSKTVLWNHDQDHPIAACVDIGIKAGRMEALVQFPDAGISAKADEVYGLLKAGVINATSIGFLPLDVEPADGKNPRKGLRIDESELLEFSFVSVPANPGAQVIQRSFPAVAPAMSVKGLYAVAALAQLLQSLGYQVESSENEASREGDNSAVPGQLRDALGQLGAALVAMTTEEVAELLADPEDVDDAGCDVPYMMYALRGMVTKIAPAAVVKAGRKFSKATTDAMKCHLDAVGAAHTAMTKMLDEAEDPDVEDSDDPAKKAAREAQHRKDFAKTSARAKRVRELDFLALKIAP